ncbi:MAG: LPS-assembly protein LptD [Ectothiorhodospira sp.]
MYRRLLLLPCLAGLALPAAADPWALCESQPPPPELRSPEGGDERVRFLADEARMDTQGRTRLEGEVEVHQLGRNLRADRMTYDPGTDRLTARGAVRLTDPDGFQLESPGGYLDLNDRTGRFESGDYRYLPRHARGSAREIEPEGSGRFHLEGATFTTCDPGREDWLLRAETVDLDRDSGRGTARDVLLRFYGVPLFYTPWIDFPIDDRRQSGLLVPSLGNGNNTGLDIEIPYYLNLAPNRDATIAPRLIGRRGTMLRTELRYLEPRSAGEIQVDLLPDDRIHGDRRSHVDWEHTWAIAPRMRLHTQGTDVSDPDYFDDLGSSLDDTSQTHLQRLADLRYWGRGWNLMARVEDFQTLDENLGPANRPYKRLPQMRYQGHWPGVAGDLNLDLQAEWVAFEREDSVTARRTDLQPTLSLPLRGPAWFLTPKLDYRFTHYALEDAPPNTGSHLQRELPTFSLDGGLIFERITGEDHLQILEPRIFYTYTPYRDQDAIPRFDTSEYNFDFDQLFRSARFSGPDRVADGNRVTTALTTRIIDPDNAEEHLRASLGQIHYLADQRVRLNPARPAIQRARSPLVGEIAWRPTPGWRLSGAVQWDPQRERTERSSTQLRYQDGRRILNLSHRLREERLRQGDLSFAWPLSERWSAVGRWAYSLRDERDLEVLAGLEYQACCWGARIVSRRYLTDGVENEYTNGIYFQLVLKGLASLGSGLDELLNEGILGYENTD